MTPGIGFTLAAMVCFGASDLIYKRGAMAGIGGREFAMLQAWVFFPGVTVYALASGTLDLHASALWGAVAGVCLVVAVINFIASLQAGAVSTNAPVFRLNFAIAVLLAIIVLGETLNAAKLAALAATFAAVWLLLAEPGAFRARPDMQSFTRVLIATVAMGCGNFCYKLGVVNGALPETMIVAQAMVFCPAATVIYWLGNRHFAFTPGAWRYTSAAAVILVAGFVIQLHGLAVGPASVLVPVSQMGFVITALLGALIFRETLDGRKQLGLIIAVAALALFAVS
jgi:uncharacterized membrane protein